MMKAFVRRYGAAVIGAFEESNVELATAWERLHTARHPSTAAETATATAAVFDRAYDAYVRHVETTAPATTTTATGFCFSRSPTAAAAVVASAFQFRRTCRLAVAWESVNRRRIRARQFADLFAGADGAAAAVVVTTEVNKNGTGEGAAAAAEAATTTCSDGSRKSTTINAATAAAAGAAGAAAAVVSLVVAPMLLGRSSSQMCDCGLGDTISGAVDWVSFNEGAFEAELRKMEGTLWQRGGEARGAGEGGVMGRVLEGCECREPHGSPSSSLSSCARLVACPVVTRRYLKAPEPECSVCREEDAFLGGDLSDLFS